MAIPGYEDLVNPLLQAFHACGNKATIAEQERIVADNLRLTDADISEIHRGRRTRLAYSLAWARNYLKRLGLIQSVERGLWVLTAQGEQQTHVDDQELRSLAADLQNPDQSVEGLDLQRPDIFGEYPIDSLLIRQETRTVFEIVRRIRDGKFVLNPDFQREFIWSLDKQSRLIESTLLRIPLPVLYLAEREDGKTVVVDGLQRLTTFKRYLDGEFRLKYLEIAAELNGSYFHELPPKLQNRIEDSQLILYLIDSKVPEQAKLDIFERVNGGVPLSRQQMRNCLYSGPATNWLYTESNEKLFLEATGHSLSRTTMRDRECINRFCAFEILTEDHYSRGDMDRFLAEALVRMNQMDDSLLSTLSRKFRESMQNNLTVFDKHAFRKHDNAAARRSVINVALFDVLSTVFSRIDPEVAEGRASEIRETFYNLIHHQEFADSISFSTNSSRNVRTRFVMARDYFSRFTRYVD